MDGDDEGAIISSGLYYMYSWLGDGVMEVGVGVVCCCRCDVDG